METSKSVKVATILGNAEFMKENVLFACVANVVKNPKTGAVTFESVHRYHRGEQITLSKDEQCLWDLFNDFRTPKNAANVLFHCIETKAGITEDIFTQQGKITPSEEAVKNAKDVEDYPDFIRLINPESKAFLIGIAKEWLGKYYNGETSFDAFFVNGTNGVTLKNGDYVLGYDPVYSQPVAGKVIQATPNGFVTCADNQGSYTLSHAVNPRVASKEELPAEIVGILDEAATRVREAALLDKETVLGRVAKANERKEVAAKKEADKAEKLATKKAAADKLDADKKAKYEELSKLVLDTPEKVKDAVAQLNQAKLSKELHGEISGKIKAAQKALKVEVAPATPAAKKTTAAPAPAKLSKLEAEKQAIKDEKKAAKANHKASTKKA